MRDNGVVYTIGSVLLDSDTQLVLAIADPDTRNAWIVGIGEGYRLFDDTKEVQFDMAIFNTAWLEYLPDNNLKKQIVRHMETLTDEAREKVQFESMVGLKNITLKYDDINLITGKVYFYGKPVPAAIKHADIVMN